MEKKNIFSWTKLCSYEYVNPTAIFICYKRYKHYDTKSAFLAIIH